MSADLSIDFFKEGRDPICTIRVFGETDRGGLRENGRYEYELGSPEFSLQEQSGIIRHSRIEQDCERGLIEPGNYVGLLKLTLLERSTGIKMGEAHVDVRSRKLSYETEYRKMLEDIADRCADFLLQLESPVEQRFAPEDTKSEATLAQRLYFLKSLVGGEDFQMAVQRIVSMPNTEWMREEKTVDVRNSRRLGRKEIRQFVSSSRRVPTPERHPLHGRMKSLPERLQVVDKRDTVDTPENRFVKYALQMFLTCLESMLETYFSLKSGAYPELESSINELIEGLEDVLSHEVFKQVSMPTLLPLNSPVLQRKEGYRQVLRAWMLFELAAKLSWSGGDDVYEGGKRDAAALYEYWVFFRMLDLVAGLFELDKPLVEELINDKDLVLKLKAGKHLPIEGVYRGAGRPLRIEFSYNRSFGINAYPAQGSWTRKMRPDYTLSLWPQGFTRDEAEEQELITHVHFDAKYKVDRLTEMFGNSEEDLDQEKQQQRAGTYKRGDLLKMHAYRDAIRRSAGAYVLYPGEMDDETCLKGFHELLPGLGAFPLRPDATDDGSNAVLRFLKEVVAHVCNRATQRERQSYHTYRIHETMPGNDDQVREALSEKDGGMRSKPVAESYVIHGWHKGDAHLAWVEENGLYNFRTDDRRGSLRLHETVSGASYLFLHGSGEYRGGGRLYKITSDGPRVFSKETLIEKGYSAEASQPYYLVFDVAPLDADDPLRSYDWDLSLVEGIADRRGSAIPKKGIPLHVFMKGAKRRGRGFWLSGEMVGWLGCWVVEWLGC
jgi:predicted component of viral defense system (DUF524 family)